MRWILSLVLAALGAVPAQASICGIDPAAVEARIAELEPRLGLLLSDFGRDAPTVPAHLLMHDPASSPDWSFWRKGRLDDLARVDALENATGQEVDIETPARDRDVLAARDTCTDGAGICEVLIEQTNGSLGGTSPYPQQDVRAAPAPRSSARP
jgi:hypothetical protein